MPRTFFNGYVSSGDGVGVNLTECRPKVRREALTAIVLSFVALACRPVLTIGWGEMLLFGLILVILVGPPVYRLLRRLEEFRKQERSKEEKRGNP